MASHSAAVKRPPAPSLLARALRAGGRLCATRRAAARHDVRPRVRPRSISRRRADGEVAVEAARRRGRGAQSNASGRYEPVARIAFDDGWQSFEELPPFKTTVTIDSTRKIITRNDSPDISFDRSINPYRGCEHGCIYCFARPTHAYLGLSPGLDFESKLFAKPEARQAARTRTVGAGLRAAHHRDRHQHRSLPADRARSIRSCAASSKCWSASAIRSASSPSRRWSCATSTSWRAWPSAIWSRSRCR